MKKNKYSTPLWVLATILAGMLSPMQSAVNGQLGHWLQDGNACAVISFASGLVVMFFIIMARKEIRQQFAAIPSLIKNRKVPLWNWFAGLCGAMVVFSEGASASALGVATFQTALISALLLSGLLCDRFGIGVDEKKYFTPYRIIGALFAVIATIFVVSPQWHSTSFILLAILCVFRSIRSRIGIEVRSAIRIHSINRELNFFYRFLTRFFAAFHYRGIFPQ
ncbi:Putative inner membrane protein [Escherichia coli]|nr:Putative inner membrane protein [Escherichia coli]